MAPSILGKSRASFWRCLAEATTWEEIFSKRSKKTVSFGRRLNMLRAAPGELRNHGYHVKAAIVGLGDRNANGVHPRERVDNFLPRKREAGSVLAASDRE